MNGDPTRNEDGSQRRILVLEQDAAILDSLMRILELDGFSVSKASSLQQGKEIAQSQVLDGMLVGEDFHDGDGIAFTQTVRGLGFSAPILLLRTVGGSSFSQKAAEAGATSVLTKPFTLEDLRTALSRALEASAGEIFSVGPSWGKPTRQGKDSSRSILWMGILASLLIGFALLITIWAFGI